MKRSFLNLGLLFLVLSVISCNRGEEGAAQVAREFLTQYLKPNHIEAAALCTPQLAEELISSLKGVDSLEEGVKESIRSKTAEIVIEILNSNRLPGKDSVEVDYRVLIPGFPNNENRLLIVKIDDQWRVAALGKW